MMIFLFFIVVSVFVYLLLVGGKQPLSIVSFFADLKKNRSQYSTTQLFSAEEYNEMCDGLIQYEPMSDPKKYEPKDPRDIKIEHLEKDLDKLQKDVESLMKKVVGNENSIKKKQDKLQEDFGKCDAKI